MLLLFLLRLSAEHPPPAPSSPQTHSTCIASSNGISPPADRSTEEAEVERPKKRKRKIDKPRRYIGPGVQIEGADDSPGFPWDRRAVRETVAPHASPGWSNSEESGTEPEALNRRLEALMDRLCLKQVTASLSLDLDLSYSLASGSQGQEQTQDGSQGQSQAQIATAHEEAQLLFGSAGRPIDPHDEHDELQWFCADIVQPMFGSSLPHQCAAIRNKCFVPGVSTITPSRLANTHDREIERVAASRADTDLVARRAERVRAQKELKAARPALADVLRAETRSAQPGVAAAQRARAARAQERQVEMNRRFARSSSASSMVPPHLPQSPRPVLHATTSETVARLSKRKARSPQRRVTDPTNAGNAGPQTLVLATPTKPRAPFAQRPGISQYRFTVPELAFAPRTPATAFRRAESQPVGTIDAFWTDDGKGGDIDCIAGTRLPTSPVRVETRRKETQYPSNLGAQYSLASRVTTASHPASTETPSPARSTSDVEQTFVVEASPDRSSLQSMSDSRVRLASLSDQLRPGPAPLRPRNPFARSESQPAGRVAFGRSFGAQNSTAFGARAVLTRCERTPNSTRALDGSGEYTSGSDVEEDDIEHVVAGKRISSLQQADLRSARSPFATAATSALAAARAAPPRVASTVQPFVR